MKITYLAAASEDGFIAREDGDVAWLDDQPIDPGETGLEEFFASIDGLVMGRATYDFVFNYGTWPYQDKPTWVCTSKELVPLDGATILTVAAIETVIREARAKNRQHLWLVGGGELASSFLEEDLLTHLSISEMPINLGTGIPLFARHRLNQLKSKSKTIVEKKGFRQIEMEL